MIKRALKYLFIFNILALTGLLVGIGARTYEEWLDLTEDFR